MGNLSAFMKPEFKKNKIVEVPGFNRFTKEDGTVENFKIKILSFREIENIRDIYRTERTVIDKKTKKPLIQNNQIVKEYSYDNIKAALNIFIEALVHPNLKDKELMAFYGVEDVMDMPYAVFTQEEYIELQNIIAKELHLASDDEDEDDRIKQAKN